MQIAIPHPYQHPPFKMLPYGRHLATQIQIHPHISLYHAQKEISMPLKKVSLDVSIIESTCQMEFTHEFINSSKFNLESEFSFPIDNEWAVSSLTIQLDDKVLESKIIEAQSANEKFEQQTATGNSAFKMQYKDSQLDMLSMKIGRLISGKTAIFKTKLVGKLNKERGMWFLRIPFTCFPRYEVSMKPHSESAKYTQNTLFGFEFSCKITSSHEITPYLKDDKNIAMKLGADKRSLSIAIPLAKKYLPNKDMKISYSLGEGDAPQIYAQKNALGETAFLFSITPSIKSVDVEAKGEFIFVIDCSGSMRGKKMEYARSSCRIFLQSLPVDCYFNIYKFGYQFKSFHAESLKYSNDTLKKALTFVNDLQANMGGTEIYSPLDAIFKVAPKAEYPRNVFLLTDGEVENTQQIIALIIKNNFSSKVHTVGVGEGASRALVKGCANAGNGVYQFVSEGDNISKCVVSMLEKCVKPALTSCEFNLPKGAQVEVMTPLKIPFIYQGEAFSIYGITKGLPEGEITLTALWSHNLEKVCYKCLIPKEMAEGDYLFPLTVKQLFNNELELDKTTDVKLSTKYHILSKNTALMTVFKNLELATTETKKAIVPKLLPADYKIVYQIVQPYYQFNQYPNVQFPPNYRAKGGLIYNSACRAPSSGLFPKGDLCCKAPKTMACKEKRSACPTSSSSSKRSLVMKSEQAMNVMDEENKECGIAEKVVLSALDNLLGLQDISGFWEMCEEFYKVVLSKEKLDGMTVEEIKGLPEDALKKVLATLVAVKILNTKFISEKDSWKLIENKAMKFLRLNGVDYSKCESKIMI